MRLYYMPGACSLSPHIVLREAGLPFELDRIDFATRKTEGGVDFGTVNHKGMVPALRLDNGEILTEGAVIVQYLGDQKPGSGLVPPAGSMARYRVQEWLNYVASELHKTFSPLFNPKTPDEFSRDAEGAAFQAIRASRPAPGEESVPGRLHLYRGRCLLLHRPALDRLPAREPGHRTLAEPEGLFRPHRRPPEGPGGHEGRGPEGLNRAVRVSGGRCKGGL